MQCDSEWEHGYGVSINTLDNPGWDVRIDVTGTPLAAKSFKADETHRSEHDWYVLSLEGATFRAACGPLNLGEVLHLFRLWVDGPPALAT